MNWVILRGLARQAEHWGDFKHQFEDHPDVKKVLALDLPGFGRKAHLRFPLSIKKVAHILDDKLKSLSATGEPWGILGISLGGMVTLEWVNSYPGRFKAAVVINSSLNKNTPVYRRIKPSAALTVSKMLISKPDPVEQELAALRMTSNHHTHNVDQAQRWADISVRNPMKVSNVVRQLAASSRYKGPKKVPIPLLILGSEKDNMVNVKCSKKMAQRYSAPALYHPTAGHDIPLDDPSWVINHIVKFQESLSK